MVKLMKVLTTLFMIGTFAYNGYIGASGFMIDWGFYPDKTTPSIQADFDMGTNTTSIFIPVYVNNTGAIGFPIENLRIDFSIHNETALVTQSINNIGTIAHGSGMAFNVTLIKEDSYTLFLALNGSTSLRLQIYFQITYVVSTVLLDVGIDLPGGLSF